MIEQLNRIELIGVVGRDARIANVGDTSVASFALATNYAYKDRGGNAIIETTWHSIKAWKGSKMPDLADIKKGTWLHVKGRLRNVRYTDQQGIERTMFEVLAGEMEIVDPKAEK